jgi:hypothetical protein
MRLCGPAPEGAIWTAANSRQVRDSNSRHRTGVAALGEDRPQRRLRAAPGAMEFWQHLYQDGGVKGDVWPANICEYPGVLSLFKRKVEVLRINIDLH